MVTADGVRVDPVVVVVGGVGREVVGVFFQNRLHSLIPVHISHSQLKARLTLSRLDTWPSSKNLLF